MTSVAFDSRAALEGTRERAKALRARGSAEARLEIMEVAEFELARYGITVNAVAPTFVATELTRSTLEDPEWRERILSRIPLGRVGEVEDVVAATVYLASPAAAMVTGHTLLVDGGWTAW